jgi:hypothetical protein
MNAPATRFTNLWNIKTAGWEDYVNPAVAGGVVGAGVGGVAQLVRKLMQSRRDEEENGSPSVLNGILAGGIGGAGLGAGLQYMGSHGAGGTSAAPSAVSRKPQTKIDWLQAFDTENQPKHTRANVVLKPGDRLANPTDAIMPGVVAASAGIPVAGQAASLASALAANLPHDRVPAPENPELARHYTGLQEREDAISSAKIFNRMFGPNDAHPSQEYLHNPRSLERIASDSRSPAIARHNHYATIPYQYGPSRR